MADAEIMAEEMQPEKKLHLQHVNITTQKNAKKKKLNLSKCSKSNVVK